MLARFNVMPYMCSSMQFNCCVVFRAVTCEELGRDVVKSIPERQRQNRLIRRVLERKVRDDLQVVGASRRRRCE